MSQQRDRRISSENGCFHPGWCSPYMTVSWEETRFR